MMQIKIDKSRLERVRKLVRALSNGTTSGLWDRVTEWISSVKDKLFDGLGGDYGRKKWPGISPSLYGKIRRSSLGAKVGRYESGSKPLQASGRYRQSFQPRFRPRVMTYGPRIKKPDPAVFPYAGWNRKDGRYTPRYALPDMTNRKTVRELRGVYRTWIKDLFGKVGI